MPKSILALVLTLLACSHPKHAEKEPDDDLSALEDKFEAKLAATAAILDPTTGWPAPLDCDGLLWAGKAAAVGLPTNVDLAEYAPGELHRRPPPSCWNETDGDVGSKSTISNDMVLGWLWAKWSLKDLAALQRLAAYGEEHNWQMGKPLSQASRVVLKPNQIGMLGRMIHVLSNGADSRSYRHLFDSYLSVEADYERHLQALGILLQGEVEMEALDIRLVEISDQMLARLHELVDAEPQNPLFHAALARYTGDYDQAITLLLADDTPVPTYVRGDHVEALAAVEWLFAAGVVIRKHHDQEEVL